MLTSRLRTSLSGGMDGREGDLKRLVRVADNDADEEPLASAFSSQARYFMASGEPRSMR